MGDTKSVWETQNLMKAQKQTKTQQTQNETNLNKHTTKQPQKTQSNTNTGGIENGWHMITFDFDNATAGADKFISMNSSTNAESYWSFQAWIDPDAASSSFGTVKSRTAGILVT